MSSEWKLNCVQCERTVFYQLSHCDGRDWALILGSSSRIRSESQFIANILWLICLFCFDEVRKCFLLLGKVNTLEHSRHMLTLFFLSYNFPIRIIEFHCHAAGSRKKSNEAMRLNGFFCYLASELACIGNSPLQTNCVFFSFSAHFRNTVWGVSSPLMHAPMYRRFAACSAIGKRSRLSFRKRKREENAVAIECESPRDIRRMTHWKMLFGRQLFRNSSSESDRFVLKDLFVFFLTGGGVNKHYTNDGTEIITFPNKSTHTHSFTRTQEFFFVSFWWFHWRKF